jgi:membrane-bound lytic murein transglycosylase D
LSEKCVFRIVSAKKFLYNATLGDVETLARGLLVLRRESEVAMKQRCWLLSFCFSFLLLMPLRLTAESQPSNPSPFPVPAGLEPSVEFWKKVFTEYSLSQLIYFDPLDMGKIYEVNDVGEGSRSNEYINAERARIAAENRVDIDRVKAQRGVKERTAAGLKRSGRYIAQIQRIFRDRDLPAELTYLPVVESSYDIYARSSVGALGIWQFMPRTGREYMRVTATVDERRDPFESSRAAASYLKQAYEFLGSWPLAITSYNYGQAGMARAVAAVGSDNLVDLIQRYEHPNWGFAPKQFYAEFLAAVEIGTNLNKYYPDLQLDAPVEIKEVELNSTTPLTSVINSSGLSRDEFLGWNPALNSATRIVPGGYRVKVPVDRTMEPLVTVAQSRQAARQPQPKSQVVRQPQPQSQVVRHRVKRGETLSVIARRYGASVQRILDVNGIRKAHLVKVGTTLVIPKI